jgi:hypothetical protein
MLHGKLHIMDGVLFSSSSYQVFFTLLYYSFRDNVYATSYAPLVQDYEVCRYDELVVFYSYLGIASGDVSLIAPFWTLFFMGVLLFLQYICGLKIPKKISFKEREQILDLFATSILIEQQRMKNAIGITEEIKASSIVEEDQ